MALKFSCPVCGTEIVAKFLRVNEQCKCQNCGSVSLVPATAVESGQPSSLIEHIRDTQPPPRVEEDWRFGYRLAGRGTRYVARLIDDLGLILMFVITVASSWLFKGMNMIEDIAGVILILMILAYLMIQGYLISTRGQSIGKMIFGIKIVSHSTGEDCGFVRIVLVREVLNFFIGFVPFYALADVMLIFSKDKRCIHDHLAGTSVVELSKA